LVFNESGYIEILKQNNERINLKDNDEIVRTGNSYFRATLEFDGVFTISLCILTQRFPRAIEAGTLFGLYQIIFARLFLLMKVLALVGITASATSNQIKGQDVNAQKGIHYSIQMIPTEAASQSSYRDAKKMNIVPKRIYII
jgi:hypothetical protein